MTRYVLAYFGTEIRGPFDFATEAAIAALFVTVGNPEGLEVVPVSGDDRPAMNPVPLSLEGFVAPEVVQ